jgi:DME family drug/metabolite transporter
MTGPDHHPFAGHSAAPRAGLIALTGAGILWGTIGIVVRLLQDGGMTSTSIAFWRWGCACVILLPILGRSGLRSLRLQLRDPARLSAVALSSLVFQLLYFFAVRDIGAGVATLVTLGIAPVVLHLTDALSSRSLPSRWTLLVLALALSGLALVSLGHHDGRVAPSPLLGLLEALGSGLAYAASTAWSRPLATRLGPMPITFTSSALGLVLSLPVVALTGWHVPRTSPTVGGILWLGVVTTVIAYGLFYSGLRSTPGSIAMIVTLLEPVTAVALAALLLAEPLTAPNVVGGSLLLASVIALYARPRPRAGPPPH